MLLLLLLLLLLLHSLVALKHRMYQREVDVDMLWIYYGLGESLY